MLGKDEPRERPLKLRLRSRHPAQSVHVRFAGLTLTWIRRNGPNHSVTVARQGSTSRVIALENSYVYLLSFAT